MNLLMVALGGAIGAVLRYSVGGLMIRQLGDGFPWGTLSVNLLGSLVIGLLWGVLNMEQLSPATKNLVFVGILGSFTTFSTFAWDAVYQMKAGELKMAILYIIITNVAGILLALGGYQVGKSL